MLDKDWIGCDNPKEFSEEELKKIHKKMTSYNIMRSMQEKIANIRTDLDSFSTVEAFALMTSGLKMVRTDFSKEIQGFQIDPNQHTWKSLDIEPHLTNAGEAEGGRISRLLKVAKTRAFKIWFISIIWIHLKIFDRWFLEKGELDPKDPTT